MNKSVYYSAFAVVVVVGLVAVIVYLMSPEPFSDDAFVKCLTEKGFVFAGTDGCGYCKQQKDLFGSSLEFVDYKNCDIETQWCAENGITRYPTWVDSQGIKHRGVKSPAALSGMSDCELAA